MSQRGWDSRAVVERTYPAIHFGESQRDQVSDKSEKMDISVTICGCLMWGHPGNADRVIFSEALKSRPKTATYPATADAVAIPHAKRIASVRIAREKTPALGGHED
jgi:hypothetical protein